MMPKEEGTQKFAAKFCNYSFSDPKWMQIDAAKAKLTYIHILSTNNLMHSPSMQNIFAAQLPWSCTVANIQTDGSV